MFVARNLYNKVTCRLTRRETFGSARRSTLTKIDGVQQWLRKEGHYDLRHEYECQVALAAAGLGSKIITEIGLQNNSYVMHEELGGATLYHYLKAMGDNIATQTESGDLGMAVGELLRTFWRSWRHGALRPQEILVFYTESELTWGAYIIDMEWGDRQPDEGTEAHQFLEETLPQTWLELGFPANHQNYSAFIETLKMEIASSL